MRRYPHLCRFIAVTALGLGAAACHHGSSGIATTTATADAAGIWTGTDSISGLAVTGLINTAGQSEFIRADGLLFAGTLVISESTLSGTLYGYSPYGTTFPDGSDFGLGTFGATVVTAASIDATWNFTTVKSATTENMWSLSYDPLYITASSTTAIAGTYTNTETIGPSAAATVTISASGAISATSTASGCVLTGQVTANEPTDDIYKVTFSYASCTDTTLNGVQFAGLGMLNSAVTPAQVLVAVTGEAPDQSNYGLVMTLTAS